MREVGVGLRSRMGGPRLVGRCGGGRQLWLLVLLQVLVVVSLVQPLLYGWFDGVNWLGGRRPVVDFDALRLRGNLLPEPTELAKRLLVRNSLPPRNLDLFPSLFPDRVVIVLYVHYRPKYLQLVVSGLSAVEGINETLLIVSHDGFYEDMNAIVESIRFCQVSPFIPLNLEELSAPVVETP